MPTRRQLLRLAAQTGIGLAMLPPLPGRASAATPGASAPDASVVVNDVHSKLNPTQVDSVVAVDSEPAIRADGV